MKQRPEYIALRQAIIDNSYTIQQVQNASITQAASIAGVSEASMAPYFENTKAKIIREMESTAITAKISSVKAGVKTWLDNNFPQHIEESDEEGGKFFITIWPEGKP